MRVVSILEKRFEFLEEENSTHIDVELKQR